MSEPTIEETLKATAATLAAVAESLVDESGDDNQQRELGAAIFRQAVRLRLLADSVNLEHMSELRNPSN